MIIDFRITVRKIFLNLHLTFIRMKEIYNKAPLNILSSTREEYYPRFSKIKITWNFFKQKDDNVCSLIYLFIQPLLSVRFLIRHFMSAYIISSVQWCQDSISKDGKNSGTCITDILYFHQYILGLIVNWEETRVSSRYQVYSVPRLKRCAGFQLLFSPSAPGSTLL